MNDLLLAPRARYMTYLIACIRPSDYLRLTPWSRGYETTSCPFLSDLRQSTLIFCPSKAMGLHEVRYVFLRDSSHLFRFCWHPPVLYLMAVCRYCTVRYSIPTKHNRPQWHPRGVRTNGSTCVLWRHPTQDATPG